MSTCERIKSWLNNLGPGIITGIVVGILVAIITTHYQLWRTNLSKDAEERKNSVIMLKAIKEELIYNKNILEQQRNNLSDSALKNIKIDTIKIDKLGDMFIYTNIPNAFCESISEKTWEASITTGAIATTKNYSIIFLLSKVYSRIDAIKKDLESFNYLSMNIRSPIDFANFKTISLVLYKNMRHLIKLCNIGISIIDLYINQQEGKIDIEKYNKEVDSIYKIWNTTKYSTTDTSILPE